MARTQTLAQLKEDDTVISFLTQKETIISWTPKLKPFLESQALEIVCRKLTWKTYLERRTMVQVPRNQHTNMSHLSGWEFWQFKQPDNYLNPNHTSISQATWISLKVNICSLKLNIVHSIQHCVSTGNSNS